MGLDVILIMVFAFVVLEIASNLRRSSIVWFNMHSEKLNWSKWAQLARSMFCSEHLKNAAIEACWVLFRFLYWGQLADPCLIIHIDDVGWSVVSERFV